MLGGEGLKFSYLRLVQIKDVWGRFRAGFQSTNVTLRLVRLI